MNLTLVREMFKFAFFFLITVAVATCAVLPNITSDERILGGHDAVKGQFPYQAAIRDFRGEHVCGAVIIAPRFLLTSAARVQYYKVSNIKAFVGASTLTDGTRRKLERIIKHPDFSARKNDIAVLQTATPIIFDSQVAAIALPTTSFKAGTKVLVAGWGNIAVSGIE